MWLLKKNSTRMMLNFWFLNLDWNQWSFMRILHLFYTILTLWMLTQISSSVPSSVNLIHKWTSMHLEWTVWTSNYQPVQTLQHIMLRPLPEACWQWYNIIHLFSKHSIWIRDISIKIWLFLLASSSPIFECCYTLQIHSSTNLIAFKAWYSPWPSNFGWIFRIFIVLSSIKG